MEEPGVLGAVTDRKLREQMEALGVTFRKGEPSSGIIGASGILLGLGDLEGIPGVCLMGETSGYFVDPRSARSVLKVLASYMGIEIDYSKLEDKAKQIDEITSRIKENIEDEADEGKEDLRYFG
jgi:proteasome assembly chaperone (PAC2) family protein